MDHGLGVPGQHRLHDFPAKSLFGIGCRPEDTAGNFGSQDDGETRSDARSCGDEDDGFEGGADANDAAGRDAAFPDVGRRRLDGVLGEVSCVADDDGEVLAVGVGNGGEAVPVSERVGSETDGAAGDGAGVVEVQADGVVGEDF